MKSMNLLNKILFSALILGVSFTGCSDDDDDDNPTPATNTGGGSGSGGGNSNPSTYTSLGNDPSGDVTNNGLDVLKTEYLYDDSKDSLYLRVTTSNLSSHPTHPSVDFNFVLPNGTVNNDALGQPYSGSIMTHKSIHVYTDDGGMPPSTYTYNNNTSDFAVNGINLTKDTQTAMRGSDLEGICSGCVDLNVDVASNTITVALDRKQLITDTEVGATKSAKLKMSSGVGNARRGTDTGTDGAEFTIYIK